MMNIRIEESIFNDIPFFCQMSTSAGWSDVMAALEKDNSTSNCNYNMSSPYLKNGTYTWVHSETNETMTTTGPHYPRLEPWGECGHIVVAR